MKKHNIKVGDSMVLNRRDGSSQSVKVVQVATFQVKVAWATSATTSASVWVYNDQLDCLVPFPKGALFLAV